MAAVTALYSHWLIGLFSLSTKIDGPLEVPYGLWHRKLFPIIAPLLGQQSALRLITKSDKKTRISESSLCHGHTAVGCIRHAARCWLLSL